MSLIPSTTAGSTTSSYFIKNAGTDSAPVISTDDAGTVRVDASTAGAAFIQGTGSSLTLGANGTAFNMLALGSSPSATVQANVPLVCANTALFLGAVDMSQTAPLLRTFTQPGVVASDGINTALPQPAGLPVGLYAVSVQSNATPVAALSTIAYWNGTGWTIGGSVCSVAITGGPVGTFRINPGATLTYKQDSGAPVSLNFIYYTQLGSQFI